MFLKQFILSSLSQGLLLCLPYFVFQLAEFYENHDKYSIYRGIYLSIGAALAGLLRSLVFSVTFTYTLQTATMIRTLR